MRLSMLAERAFGAYTVSARRDGRHEVDQGGTGRLLHLETADVRVVERGGIHLIEPCRIEGVLRAVNREKGAFAGIFHVTVAAAVVPVRDADGSAEAESREMMPDIISEHAGAHRRDEGQRHAERVADVGHVAGAAADGKMLIRRLDVFAGGRKVRQADDDVHAGGAEHKDPFHGFAPPIRPDRYIFTAVSSATRPMCT